MEYYKMLYQLFGRGGLLGDNFLQTVEPRCDVHT